MKSWNEIKTWRKERRAELIARRGAFGADERHGWNDRVTAWLEQFVPVTPGTVVGFCWPFKGEIDARFAVRRWRDQVKATGQRVDGRLINTSSGAGLQGSVGQSNYAAAKGGIASLTLVQAAELSRYGITANALAPAARTGMTEKVFADMMKNPGGGAFDHYDPANVAPLVVWQRAQFCSTPGLAVFHAAVSAAISSAFRGSVGPAGVVCAGCFDPHADSMSMATVNTRMAS